MFNSYLSLPEGSYNSGFRGTIFYHQLSGFGGTIFSDKPQMNIPTTFAILCSLSFRFGSYSLWPISNAFLKNWSDWHYHHDNDKENKFCSTTCSSPSHILPTASPCPPLKTTLRFCCAFPSRTETAWPDAGWWFQPTPLKNMNSSIGMMKVPNWMEK